MPAVLAMNKARELWFEDSVHTHDSGYGNAMHRFPPGIDPYELSE